MRAPAIAHLLLLSACSPTWEDTGAPFTDADGDGYSVEFDCDDADPQVSPSALEICNEIDDDCDGDVDTADDTLVGSLSFPDADGDGWGAGEPTTACDQAPGQVARGGDCDDQAASVHPMADEACNEVDDNCNDVVDDDPTEGQTVYNDRDGDGAGAPHTGRVVCSPGPSDVLDGTDCDDLRPDVRPGLPERCNGVDDDCNGLIDDAAAVDAVAWFHDADSDGFGAGDVVIACTQPGAHVADDGDCDDTSALVGPHRSERCNDVDDDCDGGVDNDAVDGTLWFLDLDGDGWGSPEQPRLGCSAPAASIDRPGDCDDLDRLVHPERPERCDGVDTDCDGFIDAGASIDPNASPVWYEDRDGDGFGAGDPTGRVACQQGTGFSLNAEDCDDDEAKASPDLIELCDDAIDNDCDASSEPCGPVGSLTLGPDTLAWQAPPDTSYVELRPIADLDGDGFPEIAARTTTASGVSAVTLISGAMQLDATSAALALWTPPVGGTLFPAAAGSGDFDGDGTQDVAMTVGGKAAGLYLLSSPAGGGQLDATSRVSTDKRFGVALADEESAQQGRLPTVGSLDRGLSWLPDQDGDGDDELIGVFLDPNGDAELLLIEGGDANIQTLSLGWLMPTGKHAPSVADLVADFDGDGSLDAVVGSSAEIVDGDDIIGVFEDLAQLDGRNFSDASWIGQPGFGQNFGGWARAIDDVDGDGRADILFSYLTEIDYEAPPREAFVVLGIDPEQDVLKANAPLARWSQTPGLTIPAGAGDHDGDGVGDLWFLQEAYPEVATRHGLAWMTTRAPQSLATLAPTPGDESWMVVPSRRQGPLGPRVDSWFASNEGNVHVFFGGQQ